MTIRFEDIKVHDIVLINNGDDWNGWHIVTGKWKDFFDAEALGNNGMTFVIFDEDVEEIVKKHLRISAVPGAIETLEQIAQSEVCVKETLVDGGKASFVFRPENNDFGYEAVRVASAALRAVRGEESA